MGLREEKKQATRKAISDLATRLFLDRGYDAVTTAEIAKQAKVSVPTLFKYFPTKEALVFDEDAEREELLLHTVRNRKKGQAILDALLEMGTKELDNILEVHQKDARAFLKLVRETPALRLFEENMWQRHSEALATVLKRESRTKLSVAQAESLARYILDAFHRSVNASQPKATLRSLFDLLKKGWQE